MGEKCTKSDCLYCCQKRSNYTMTVTKRCLLTNRMLQVGKDIPPDWCGKKDK